MLLISLGNPGTFEGFYPLTTSCDLCALLPQESLLSRIPSGLLASLLSLQPVKHVPASGLYIDCSLSLECSHSR